MAEDVNKLRRRIIIVIITLLILSLPVLFVINKVRTLRK